jgi:sugar fermentation stimulation protein A
MIEMPDGLVGVNTILPNRLAAKALEAGLITQGIKPIEVQREVRVGIERSRLDLRAKMPDGAEVFVEVKSSTLVREGLALFPDAVSLRGAKHLRELSNLVGPHSRAVILVLVQRSGAKAFAPADFIDPGWGQTLREAIKSGVELLVHQVDLSLTRAAWGHPLEARL